MSPPPQLHPPLLRCGKMNVACFSEMRKTVPNGCYVQSDAIAGPGPCAHSWRIAFFPNGKLPGTTDAVSLYLILDDDGAAAAANDNIHYHQVTTFRFKLYEVGGGVPLVTYADFIGGVIGKGAKKELGFERFASMQELKKLGVLEHDRFTIGCEFSILSSWIDGPATTVLTPPAASVPLPDDPDHHLVAAPPPPSVPVPPEPTTIEVKVPSDSSELHADLGRLLETMEGTDVQFDVCGKVFAAHKLVLTARSPVFKEEFFGLAKKKMTTISSCNLIQISDMDPKVFEAMLHYMYTDTFPEMEGDREEEEAVLALDLLVAADKYNLKGLKSITEDELCNYIDESRVFKMLTVAEAYQCCKLKKKCLEFMGSTNNTTAIMANQDVERLARSCPSLIKDVIAKILDAAREEKPCDSLVSNIDFYCVLVAVCAITFWVLCYVFF
ncbi:hypothetical protein PR202_gb12204 [Eleusine coracana subsp. coracana]|uniref:BTB domain-containing protein n=1 Tax=Eleusine coracana subsp. coracana TaxID=191504 RepID=A0AAV5EM67_ELECO|nr:hypothetical protein QOZ80_7BG0586050 [Eleusine coracana subsp. coracana]GJN24464.1 hypothetical protein PR202_gb12204 [Eleusine coracana subsp. coracana]